MRFNLTAMLAVTLSVTGCSERTPTAPTPVAPAPTPFLRVSGRIIDFATSQGAANLTMTWRPRDSSGATTSVQAVTDASGRYEVALPVADLFSVATPLGGFNSQSDIVFVPGKHLETDLLFNGGRCALRYGYVFDAVTRLPIAGARVTRAGFATTDENGYYRIDIGCEGLGWERWGIGTTTISVQHPAYQGTFLLDGRSENTGFSGIHRYDFALAPR